MLLVIRQNKTYLSVAEYHPQFWFSPGRDGPLPLCPTVGNFESPGASYEDASGLLQPGEPSHDVFRH